MIETFSKEDREAVEFLRKQASHLLSRKYDTDYNLLRWAQGYNHNHEEALEHLVRHLKFRRYYDLDNIQDRKSDAILEKYFPLGLVGPTGKDNKLLVIECAGRIDLQGILLSVQLNTFLTQRLRFQERMLSEINRMECDNGSQSSVTYILDLEGLKFDSKLLSVVTGPYRILWASVYSNYPEWIDEMLIVNAPNFMAILWKAVAPLLPERTRNKVKIFTGSSDWKTEVLKRCTPDNVPVHWGGTKVDKNGDPKCHEILNIPNDLIPKTLYWVPTPEAPKIAELTKVVIPSGGNHVVRFRVPFSDGSISIAINRFAERTYSMAVYHSDDDGAINWDLTQMNDWAPDFDYPGMPTVDRVIAPIPGGGIVKVKFGNEQSWFRSLQVYYKISFVDANDQPVPYECIVPTAA
uniref:CRAL-TRIO domain-containing protein n=1 Tax=Steinernema glaseri TaxID=37863 RepID=A0A1I7ZNI2_9BILA